MLLLGAGLRPQPASLVPPLPPKETPGPSPSPQGDPWPLHSPKEPPRPLPSPKKTPAPSPPPRRPLPLPLPQEDPWPFTGGTGLAPSFWKLPQGLGLTSAPSHETGLVAHPSVFNPDGGRCCPSWMDGRCLCAHTLGHSGCWGEAKDPHIGQSEGGGRDQREWAGVRASPPHLSQGAASSSPDPGTI